MSFNTPNMAYCAAENTKRAVVQLIELIHGSHKDDVERDGYEWRAIHDLVGLCEELSNALEDLVSDLEKREEYETDDWYDEDKR
jgi:hypothetical protein